MIKGIEKSLNALQDSAGNNFFYLVPMNLFSGEGGVGATETENS